MAKRKSRKKLTIVGPHLGGKHHMKHHGGKKAKKSTRRKRA
jgi:hypothetical protein